MNWCSSFSTRAAHPRRFAAIVPNCWPRFELPGFASERLTRNSAQYCPGRTAIARHSLHLTASFRKYLATKCSECWAAAELPLSFLAQHVRLGRSVAVKMLLAGHHAKPRELDRFSREARTLAELHHPNIVQIFDVADYNGCPYFTMEYLNGGSLSDRVKERPMPAKDAARMIATFAEAIHAAHQSGIIHRDLTPSNILFTAMASRKSPTLG